MAGPWYAEAMATDIETAKLLKRAETITRIFDTAFTLPGTRRTFGLDPLMGLIPVLGDFIPAVISLNLVWTAHRLGLSRSVLTKMVANILLETAVGTIPVAGDLFDFAFKANVRNLRLLRQELKRLT